MLSEVGVRPEFSCYAATASDMQWMVKERYGYALVEQSCIVDFELTTRPIASVHWTADTALVHHEEAAHPAVRLIERVLQKPRRIRTKKKSNTNHEPLQLDLLA